MLGNGNSFRVFIAESVAVLQGVQAIAYYQRPFSDDLDDKLAEIIRRFQAATPAQRAAFLAALSEKQRALFGIFGHRAATLAVRQEDPDWLLQGLIGAAIANVSIPAKRNVEVSLAVYHHCARKLGVNTVDLFEAAAQFASAEFAPILIQFGRRSDVTLRQFGWREIKTPDGVKYKFDW